MSIIFHSPKYYSHAVHSKCYRPHLHFGRGIKTTTRKNSHTMQQPRDDIISSSLSANFSANKISSPSKIHVDHGQFCVITIHIWNIKNMFCRTNNGIATIILLQQCEIFSYVIIARRFYVCPHGCFGNVRVFVTFSTHSSIPANYGWDQYMHCASK